jgi:hypothetical protein
MKRTMIVLAAMTFACASYALDLNFDLESDMVYGSYIKNDLLNLLPQQSTPTALTAFEQIRVKAKQGMDGVKMVFDGRFYVRPGTETMDYVIDNAYFSVDNPNGLVLYAGKQRIKWGTGYTFNPTDRLQPQKNALDPTRYLEGIYAVRGEWSNDFMTPSLIISPGPQNVNQPALENFRFALQLYKLVGTMDVFINSIYQMNKIQTIGSAVSWDEGIAVINAEGAVVRNMDPAENVLRYAGMGGSNDLRFNWLIGVQKQFDADKMVNIEYYRNEWGATNSQFDTLIAEAPHDPGIMNFAMLGIKKDYASATVSYTMDEKVSFSMAAIYGPDDGTTLVYPQVSWVENQNFDFLIGYLQNLTEKGNREGIYILPIYNFVEMRLRIYL